MHTTELLQNIREATEKIREARLADAAEWKLAEHILGNEGGVILSLSPFRYEFQISDEDTSKDITLCFDTNNASATSGRKNLDWDRYTLAALLLLKDKFEEFEISPSDENRLYTREGMIKRVLDERRTKADTTEYKIEWADNLYGEHLLTNERGVQYRITLRDFENETGYVDSPDLKTNKLGTTKHIMYAFQQLKDDANLKASLADEYPFVEIFLDPLNDYQITWHYPHEMPDYVEEFLGKYFGTKKVLPEGKTTDILRFIQVAQQYPEVRIRPEVMEKIERSYNRQMLEKIRETETIDFSCVSADLFPYQKEGVEFAVFKEGAIISDDMGLGKTLQAIAIAIEKKRIFGFERTLVICPASLKSQWKKEIEKFSDEKAIVVEGNKEQRQAIYTQKDAYFIITNYESVMRDFKTINKTPADFVILDEAQRIKNYETKTAAAIKQLDRRHSLVITGTPIENKLIDLFSIVQFLDPYLLAPLWEFSYQHCYFDPKSKNRITGYYNLNSLKKRMQPLLLRREKRQVIKQLPNIQQLDIPIAMHPDQEAFHSGYSHNIARILNKKFKTPYDMQRLMLLLVKMRMVCDSTYLVDDNTNVSPKLVELKHILLEKLDMPNNQRKIIIFSEWVKMNKLIGELLRELNLGYTELNGKVPVKKRQALLEKFENDDDCRVFLSTEAGGAGLNLQMADTVIKFELPWNPAKKNQRIGRIDRLGQKNEKLTVLNLITRGSIEMKIASGLILKQNLFEGVLDPENEQDVVDFSSKGRSQFLQQMEDIIDALNKPEEEYEFTQPEENLDIPAGRASEADQLPDIAEEEEKEPQPQAQTAGGSPSHGTMHSNPKLAEMEQVMQQGMGFLAGLYKMSTGEDMGADSQSINIDPDTGEVVMRFKLPV